MKQEPGSSSKSISFHSLGDSHGRPTQFELSVGSAIQKDDDGYFEEVVESMRQISEKSGKKSQESRKVSDLSHSSTGNRIKGKKKSRKKTQFKLESEKLASKISSRGPASSDTNNMVPENYNETPEGLNTVDDDTEAKGSVKSTVSKWSRVTTEFDTRRSTPERKSTYRGYHHLPDILLKDKTFCEDN